MSEAIPPDKVHELVRAAASAMRTAESPEARFLAAVTVFHEGIDGLSSIEMEALRQVGWAVILGEGLPEGPSGGPSFDWSYQTRQLVDEGRSDGHVDVPETDTAALMLCGFLGQAAEAAIYGA